MFLGSTLLLSSAGGLVVEIVAGRLIAPYVGMSLYTWTAIIAVVLAGLSAGHWIGGRLAAARVTDAGAMRRLAVALALASVSSFAALALLRLLAGPLLDSGLGPVPVVVLLSAALFLLPSLFVGIVAPVVTRLAIGLRADDPGPVIGRMYAIGTLGSIAGTLAAGYLFIAWIGSTGTIVAVATTYAVLALLCAVDAGGGFARRIGPGIAVLLVAVVGWSQATGVFVSPCERESDYFCIRIEDFSAVSGRPSAVIVLDHLAHSINDRDDPTLLFNPYIHFVDEYARHRLPGGDPLRAFFIGGGGYTLPRAWAAERPGARLVVAEIDPAVTAAARKHLWVDPADPALEIHHSDARALLQSLPAAPGFDVVFGDAFHDISVPAHLVTREFHAAVAARLTRRGIYVANVVDDGRRPRFLAALARTLRLGFAHVELWAEAEALAAVVRAGEPRLTYVVVAGREPGGIDHLTSGRGVPRQWLRLPVDTVLAAAGPGVPVLTDDFAPVDRLMATLLLAPEN